MGLPGSLRPAVRLRQLLQRRRHALRRLQHRHACRLGPLVIPAVDVLWLLPWSLAASGAALLVDAVVTYRLERRDYLTPPPVLLDVRPIE
jgi:hypothetical protein